MCNSQYEFDYKDHLGNTRVSFKADGSTLVQTAKTDTDPWGVVLKGTGLENSFQNRFEFQGKESEKTYGLNRINFGARSYNPTIGRWDRVDNKAEKYSMFSTYNYTANNPLKFVDPDGKDIFPSKLFLNSPYNPIYQNLMRGSNSYRNLLGKYLNSKEFNLKLDYNNKFVPQGFEAITITTFKNFSGRIRSPISAESEQFYSDVPISKVLNINEKSYLLELTEVGMATNLIHEALHSHLGSLGFKENDQHNTFNTYNEKFISALSEYNTFNNLGLTHNQITDLSFKGTTNSNLFRKYITGLAEKNKTTIDDELNSYKERMSNLNWKITDIQND